MMTTLICAGGSGARVLEAVLHLCAAGLGPSDLRTFVIDPDDANGNVERTRNLVDCYEKCHAGLRANSQPFFKTRLDLLASSQGLSVWSPVNSNKKFKDVLNFTGLEQEKQDLVHLLVTDKELDMEMNVGFRGHPALGAAALALLPLYTKELLWSQLASSIQHDLAQGESRVVIVGSVFGGTGASTIHPLVRYLRKLPQNNEQRLKVAAVALVPYFQFSASELTARTGQMENETANKSEWFPLASRSAAEYYQHLRENEDWNFDAMYWLGDDSPSKVDYSKGGPEQKNPSHFVDLLAAFAVLDFFMQPPPVNSCYYSGPQQSPDVREGNVVEWDDIPMLEQQRDHRRKTLHQFHLAGCAHLGFYGPLLRDARLQHHPHCVPWYRDFFVSGSQTLTSKDNKERLDVLTSYFRDFYFPWWDQIDSVGQDRVRVLNQTAWSNGQGNAIAIQTSRLGNLWYPDVAKEHGWDTVDALFSETVRCSADSSGAENLAGLYFSILRSAAQAIVEKTYAGKPCEEGR